MVQSWVCPTAGSRDETDRRRTWNPTLISSRPPAAKYTEPTNKVYCVWNVMAHAQKPDFVFRRNGRVHLNRREASVQSTTGSRGVRISGSNAGNNMFRGTVKGTGRDGVWGWQVGRPPHAPLLWGPRASGLWVCQAIFSGKLEMLIHAPFKILQVQIP